MKSARKKTVINIVVVIFGTAIFVFCGVFSVYFVPKRYIYPLYKYETVNKYAEENDLSAALVYAVIKTESGFNEKKESKKGAVGLMQIMPKTGEFIAERLNENDFDLKDGETNIRYGCYYLRYLIDKFLYTETAVCAYNAGEGRVEKWLKNTDYSLDGKTLYSVPFVETDGYLKKIKKSFKKYVKFYGDILDKKNIFE